MIMATTTFNDSVSAHGQAQAQPKAGVWARMAQRFHDTQLAKARHMTAQYLQPMSDEQLASFGWSADDIKRMRNR